MTANAFLDTNILLYFISSADSERKKTEISAELLMRDDLGLSTQVLSEFYVNAVRKSSYQLPHRRVMDFIKTLGHIPTISLTPRLFVEAAELAHRRKLSFWDSAIISTAQSMGCSILYTEDLQHGQRFDSLRVVNPFL